MLQLAPESRSMRLTSREQSVGKDYIILFIFQLNNTRDVYCTKTSLGVQFHNIVTKIDAGLLASGCQMKIYNIETRYLQHRKYIGAILKICKRKKKLIMSFDSRMRKFPSQYEHHVSCNIHHKIYENNSCNIEDQVLKYMLKRSIIRTSMS